jgi:hypothetical protein
MDMGEGGRMSGRCSGYKGQQEGSLLWSGGGMQTIRVTKSCETKHTREWVQVKLVKSEIPAYEILLQFCNVLP